MSMNESWYLNGHPESGLNPLLKLVNSNSNEENKDIISWANENGIELIDLKKYTAVELEKAQLQATIRKGVRGHKP